MGNALSPQSHLERLLPKLRSEAVTYFPVRHHSPACAAHVTRWIETYRPSAVLIEGPESFTPQLAMLADPRCVSPVAIYSRFVDRQASVNLEVTGAGRAFSLGPPRYAAYYPLCDYSPELAAIRAGFAMGSRLRFIDLDYPEKVLAETEEDGEPAGVRVESLADEPHLRHSQYVQHLVKRMGCRDFNELWDHVFEAQADRLTTDEWIDRLAGYCALARLDYTEEDLRRDGTAAREACMAAAINDELRRNADSGRPILVVTGGFHSVALPDLVAAQVERPLRPKISPEDAGVWLVRYSFDQLDALAGYAAGMPSPGFYDRLWRASDPGQVAADVLVEISRLTREQQAPNVVSTPDVIAALQMARQLADFRGHASPLREDVLDAIRSCFVKGEMDAEGRRMMQLATSVLAGARVGELPPGCGVPPIVEDFRAAARRLRLPVDRIEPRNMVLDLYRKSTHRHISRFFHRLDLLGVPFAAYLGGPDFVSGQSLGRIQEQWRVAWSPAVESALIEAFVYGPTVEEAAAGKLAEQIAECEQEGLGRSTAAAVEILLRACRLGLHEFAPRIVNLVVARIAEDPELPSVVKGLTQLELLLYSREPLEASHLSELPSLMTLAYQRSCRLLASAGNCPKEAVDWVIESIRALRETVCSNAATSQVDLDVELFHDALQRIVALPPHEAQPAIVGAAAGVLFGEGIIDDRRLAAVALMYLSGSFTEAGRTCGVLRGLLATAKEAFWQVGDVLHAIDEQFGSWDDETFLQSLPELRLAFADLTPREISKVADGVASIHGEAGLGELIHVDLDETEVRFAVEINRLVRDTLREQCQCIDAEEAT